MTSTEYWEGYHAQRAGLKTSANPYRTKPTAAEWARGYNKAAKERQQ